MNIRDFFVLAVGLSLLLSISLIRLPGDVLLETHSGSGTPHDHLQVQDYTPLPRNSPPDEEEWIPDAEGLAHWQSRERSISKWQSLPPLKAADGVTALSGQVLTLKGRPLANVTLIVDGKTARTDATGRFLLTGLKAGRHGFIINGSTASTPNKPYGMFDTSVEIEKGITNVLPHPIWLSIIDTRNVTRLLDIAPHEIVATTPRIPGLEVHIPTRSQLRYPSGRLLKTLTITPIPLDRAPFPLPLGVSSGMLLTLQMHGAEVEVQGQAKTGLHVVYPNYMGLPAGTRVNLYNYEPMGRGWYVYGQGTVTKDERQIVPDPGVDLTSMHCLALVSPDTPSEAPAPCNECEDGDPVDLGTGLFVYRKTDLILPDVIPLSLTRTYRQNDAVERSFGRGTTHLYEMYLTGSHYSAIDLILPDGGRIRFNRIDGQALYEHRATPSRFYKATLQPIPPTLVPGTGYEIRLLDGSTYQFAVKFSGKTFRASLSAIGDRYGNRLTVERDSDFRASKITTPNGRWVELTYSGSSPRVTEAKDNTGRVVHYAYDADGRLFQATDADGKVTEYTYDAAHRMRTIKDPRGIVYLTNDEYDANGRVRKQILANGGTYQFAYTLNSNGKVTQTEVTDPRGNIRRVTFNADGYWLTDTYAIGKPEQQIYTVKRQEGSNFVLSATDPLNRRTTYTRDGFGNVTSITWLDDTAGARTAIFTYEPKFQEVKSVTDPLNHTTEFEYDTKSRLLSATDALKHHTTFTHNAAGQVTSVTDPLSHTTQFFYDSGLLIEIKDPLGRSATREIDAAGRTTRITNPLGHTGRIRYDALNRPRRITDPQDAVTKLDYDENGNLLSVTDARGNGTSFTYDEMDRLESRKDGLQREEAYAYDLMGNLIKFTDRRGKVTTHRYDGLDRLSFVGFGTTGEGADETYESTITYTYDAGDRLLQAVDSLSGTITHTYDDIARTFTESTAQGTVSYSFDAAGRRTSMRVPEQAKVVYAYDDADRLTGIMQGAARVGFVYDEADRRTSLTLPNGVMVESSFDDASQLTSLTYKLGEHMLGDLTYKYDLAGQRISMGGSFARVLVPQPTASASYDAANQLRQRDASTFTYDNNGNLTSDSVNTYVWDIRDQLASIRRPDLMASFQYDAFGRRTGKAINGQTIQYVYDGVDVVQEKSGGTPSANLLLGGMDEVFMRTDNTGARTLLTDALGSTLALVDEAGEIQTQYSYEPFGRTQQNGATSSNANQYTGREHDGTGLYYYRARYYSPALQRFISEDPIGLVGGINLYAYVGNNPLSFTDPFGLRAGQLNTGPKAQFDIDQLKKCLNDYFSFAMVKLGPSDGRSSSLRFTRKGGYFAGFFTGNQPIEIFTDTNSQTSIQLGKKLAAVGTGNGTPNAGATIAEEVRKTGINYIASDVAGDPRNTDIGLLGLYIHELGNAIGAKVIAGYGAFGALGHYANPYGKNCPKNSSLVKDPDIGAVFESCVFGGLVGLRSGRIGCGREF